MAPRAYDVVFETFFLKEFVKDYQELLVTDVKYMFGHNPMLPVFDKAYNLVNDQNGRKDSVRIDAVVYEIGYDGTGFCYDNELGVHKVYLDEFEIDNQLVTNGDRLQFMESGAYADFNLWLDDGWRWVNENDINAPLYWHKVDGDWHYYILNRS